MHEAFTMNTARLWLRMPGDTDRKPLDGYFTALGFGDDDGLWPKDSSSFSGYQLCWSTSPSAKIHVHRPARAGDGGLSG
jgi:type VI protein secretion system component VasA